MSRILVVDDEPVIIRVLRYVLGRRFGERVQIEESVSFSEAKHLLAETDFDVLITDVYLVGDNGLDLILAAKGTNPCLQVIAITALPSVELIDYAAKRAVSDLLAKPFCTAEIGDRLGEAIERAARWRRALNESVCLQVA